MIFGGFYITLDPTVTEYASLVSGISWSTFEYLHYKVVSTDGVIKHLRVRLSGFPGLLKHYTFTLMLNGNPTALTFDIDGFAILGSNMVDEIVVTAGDTVSLQCDPDGTPTAVTATWSCVFEGDTSAESLILGGSNDFLTTGATEYGQVMSARSSYSATENDFRQVVPTSGIIKDFYVKLNIDPGDAPDGFRFTVRLNGATVAQSLVVSIIADATTGNDLVHNLVVVAGDVVTMMIEALNSPSAIVVAQWGMTFLADTDGESIVLGGSTSDLHDTNTEYNRLVMGATWSGTESFRYSLGQECRLEKLYILLSGSPGAGNKYTFTLRAAGDTAVVTEVADAATTGNSGALTDTVANNEYMSLKVVPTDTPTVRDAYWGFVCFKWPCPREVCFYVDGFAVGEGARDGWTKVGDSPYIDFQNYPDDYIWTPSDAEQSGDFSFPDMAVGHPTIVEVALYCRSEQTIETITVNVWDGVGWTDAGDITPDFGWAWKTVDVSAILNTRAKVTAAKIWLESNL